MSQPVNAATLEELKSIMGDEFGLLIDIFITDSAKRLVDIEKAIASANAEELRGAAHSFKGSALNISAASLTELCRELEYMGRDNQLERAFDVLEVAKVEFESVKEYLSAFDA